MAADAWNAHLETEGKQAQTITKFLLLQRNKINLIFFLQSIKSNY